MVDVLIRNVDDDLYAEFKADAAGRKLTLAQELKLAFTHLRVKKGLARDLLKLPTVRLNTKEAKTASRNIDKLASEGAYDDYIRHERSDSPTR